LAAPPKQKYDTSAKKKKGSETILKVNWKCRVKIYFYMVLIFYFDQMVLKFRCSNNISP
jgi:hypothetical protein